MSVCLFICQWFEGEGGSCMQTGKTSFVCRWFWNYILPLRVFLAENHNGRMQSRVVKCLILSVCLMVCIAECKWWLKSNCWIPYSKSFLSLHCPVEQALLWFLYVTQLPSPLWLVRNDTESEWNSLVAIVTVCCSVEVHVSHLKLKTERDTWM